MRSRGMTVLLVALSACGSTGGGGDGGGGGGDGGACDGGACPDGGGGGGGDASMCPGTQPAAGAACSGSTRCEYGTETCCGNTYPSIVCECQSGGFNCYYTDACLIPGCPDGGDTAGEGEVCGSSAVDRDAGARPCAEGLVCCYPCGIPDCADVCTRPCGEPGPGCQSDGCPGPFP
jgi:hypothetical protein